LGFLLGYTMGNSGNIGAGLAAIADACAEQGGCEIPIWFTIFMWGMIGLLCAVIVWIIVLGIISPSSFSLSPPPPPPPLPPPRPPKATFGWDSKAMIVDLSKGQK